MRSAERRGSVASDKQVWRAVKEWKQIIFFPLSGPTVEGWVIGLDDYHWVVINKYGHTFLVHKSCPTVQFTDIEPDVLGTTTEAKVRKAGDPFRSLVLSEHFGQDTESRSAAS